jgi:hypothetical protein
VRARRLSLGLVAALAAPGCGGDAPSMGDPPFAKRFGGPDDQHAFGVAVGGQGAIALAGSMRGSADFGGGALESAGGDDLFVALYDARGGHAWSRRAGDDADQAALSVAVDGDGAVIVGGRMDGTIDLGGGPLSGSADGFVAKLDVHGRHVWSQRFGGPDSDEVSAVAVDETGSVFVTGHHRGVVDVGCGAPESGHDASFGHELVLAKYAASGACGWSLVPRSLGGVDGAAIAVGGGRVFVAGTYGGALDLGGDALPLPLPRQGAAAGFVAAFDPNGRALWATPLASTDTATPAAIAASPSGDVLVAGSLVGTLSAGADELSSAGSLDAFVVSLSPSGEARWGARYGDEALQQALAVAVDPQGEILVAGSFRGTIDLGDGPVDAVSGDDAFVVKLGPGGEHRSSATFRGDGEYDRASAAAIAPTGDWVIGGDLMGTLDVGGVKLTSAGGADVLLAKLSP